MQLRAMLEIDLDGVFAIERAVVNFPWPKSQFAGSLSDGHDCTVIENNSVVAGFAIFSRVLDEATLLNIAVDPAMQGRGFGRYLLQKGLAMQQKFGATQCFLEVRLSNVKAQKLYQSLGFITVGQRKNYYQTKSGSEDALVMCWKLPA